jgi:hypothetical protein
VLDTENETPEESADRVMKLLEAQGFLEPTA